MKIAKKPVVCPLCEAGCGLLVDVEEGVATGVSGDPEDVMSKGFVCPKGLELLNLDRDPDRLTKPMRRGADGQFSPVSWEEAFRTIQAKLSAVQDQHGRDAVAVHVGTVGVHKYSVALLYSALKGALGTRNWTGAVSQDTGARFASAYLLYKSAFSISVPDIDRTDYLLCLGANPWVSNGSMMVAPNAKGRIRGIMDRGGRVVVVDPRRSETATAASEHVSLLPGTDAALVLGFVQHLVALGRVDEESVQSKSRGWVEVKDQLQAFAPSKVAAFVGVSAATIERLALEFVDAPSSVAYSRMGPGNARYATLTCYAVELLNLVAGRLGEVGGAMFPTPAVDLAKLARATGQDTFNTYRSRVRRAPETVGELPSTILAEEMEEPGLGQIKALITYAGNPVLSVPNGRRLDRALQNLDFMVSVDLYINETTRHADLILPPGSLLAEDHVDFFFANYAVREAMRWTRPALEPQEGEWADWQILLELVHRMGGGITAIRPLDTLLRWLRIAVTPAHLAAAILRFGARGDWFLPWSKGLSAKKVRASEHGVDLGPMKSGLRRRVYHPGKRIHLSHPALNKEMEALLGAIRQPPSGELLLIGRRQLRSNNSWMHNLPRLMTGKPRCVLYINPLDAAAKQIEEGQVVVLVSKIHRGEVPVHVTDEVREGVVSLPHGFGHQKIAKYQKTAGQNAGVSVNDWIDDREVEAVAGQSILNGVRVSLESGRGEK